MSSKSQVVPAFAESVTSGEVTELNVAVGDQVEEGEVIMSVNIEKSVIEVQAECSGVVTALSVEEGMEIQPGLEFITITEGDKPDSQATTETETSDETPKVDTPKKAETDTPKQKPTAPPAQKSTRKKQEFTSAPRKAENEGDSPLETREKMSPLRKIIAGRLKDSQDTQAQLTTFNDLDMTTAIEMRKKHGEAFMKKHGVKLGFMGLFLKASAHALVQNPIVNSHIEGNHIVHRHYVDISVAVAAKSGLLVPVVRGVENMSIMEIERKLVELGGRAKEGKITAEDMAGGTFTVSNGGVFGSMMGTPIINPPQTAILGMHATNLRPVVHNGKITARPMMYLALTYDHRLIDGREAVIFLKTIKQAVEDPVQMFLDL